MSESAATGRGALARHRLSPPVVDVHGPASPPNVRWVFTHRSGVGTLLVDRLELFRTAFLGDVPETRSVAEQIGQLRFDVAGTPFPRQVPMLCETCGSEHVRYGSEGCWTSVEAVGAQIRSLGGASPPDGDTWRGLTSRNARALLARATRST